MYHWVWKKKPEPEDSVSCKAFLANISADMIHKKDHGATYFTWEIY